MTQTEIRIRRARANQIATTAHDTVSAARRVTLKHEQHVVGNEIIRHVLTTAIEALWDLECGNKEVAAEINDHVASLQLRFR